MREGVREGREREGWEGGEVWKTMNREISEEEESGRRLGKRIWQTFNCISYQERVDTRRVSKW